jgi:hypothetical protein
LFTLSPRDDRRGLIGWEGEEQGLARGDRNSTNQQIEIYQRPFETVEVAVALGNLDYLYIPHHEIFPS